MPPHDEPPHDPNLSRRPPTSPESEASWERVIREAFREAPDFERPPTLRTDLLFGPVGDSSPGGRLPRSEAEIPADGIPFGRYRITGELGRGGVGVVFAADDLDLHRPVAIKVLTTDGGGESPFLRFVQEAQITSQLQHPGIVPIHEVGLDAAERPFFVMHRVQGKTLAALVAGPRRLDATELLPQYEQVCETLAYAHSRGVVHRDVKPANIMVGAFGEVFLLDWGMAGRLDPSTSEARPEIHSLREGDSIDGTVVGTPAYMSPEQARGDTKEVDERTDVFALGVVLVELLVGASGHRKLAEKEAGEPKVRSEKRRDALERLANEGIDPALIALATDCLRPDKQDRPRSAEQIVARLRAWRREVESRSEAARIELVQAQANAASERSARKRNLAWGGITWLLLTTILGGAWLAEHRVQRDVLRVERLVRSQLEIARGHASRGEFEAMLATLQNGDALLLAGPASDELRDDYEQESQRLRREYDDERERQRASLRMAEFRRGLESVLILDVDNPRSGSDEYDRVFREHGIALLEESPQDVAWRLRALDQDLWPILLTSLDAWGARRGVDTVEGRHLVACASLLDDDSERRELRHAIVSSDGETLRNWVDSHDLSTMAPESIALLAHGLVLVDEPGAACDLLRRATDTYPGAFWLHLQAAAFLGGVSWIGPGWESTPDDLQEALVQARIATSLQPTGAFVRQVHARLLAKGGRGAEGLAKIDEAIALEPNEPSLYLGRLLLLRSLSRYPEALALAEEITGRWPSNAHVIRRLGRLQGLDPTLTPSIDELCEAVASAGLGPPPRSTQALRRALIDLRRIVRSCERRLERDGKGGSAIDELRQLIQDPRLAPIRDADKKSPSLTPDDWAAWREVWDRARWCVADGD